MPVRIYDISKKLGLENKDIIAKAKALGITAAKVSSSSLDKYTAEFLEGELLKEYPEIAEKLKATKPIAVLPEEKIVVITAPPPPVQVRISDIASRVQLSIEGVQRIIKEFGISNGLSPDSLNEIEADKLLQIIQDGTVAEKRLKDIENGNKALDLQGFPWRDEWVNRIARCTHVQELNLSKTGIPALPDAFRELRNLSVLNLIANNLSKLPPWLQDLPNLRGLLLHGNDALGLPAEILGHPTSEANPAKPREILEYYLRLQSGGKRPLNEAKLILLGRGEVGKTCLVNRLVHDKFVDTAMTRGISITQWKVRVGNDEIRLHMWDFGGQEIQHATHQFFLTERSLYLVVLNGRAGAEDDDAEYWLKFINTYGGGSPTIVVLNKFSIQPFEVDELGLKEKYPFIRAFVETDCERAENTGIAQLREEINSALGAMDHIRVAFPAEWFQIKEKLSEMREPYISFQEYRSICESKNEKDCGAQETLAVFLNALGIALNFRQDARLRDETVLNPHWITKGVYQIITSPALSKLKGELRINSLKEILPYDEYPPHMHLFLIELMRKFELCFPYHDDELSHRYLVPELLGKKQPKLKEPFSPENCSNFRYNYRILPEGLLARFITRTHVMSDPSGRWRTGVILRWEGSRALVRVDRQERQIVIRVSGDQEKRRRLLAVIRENFDQIHSDMKEFRPTEWIALEQDPNQWVSQQDLEILHKKDVQEITKVIGAEVLSLKVADVLKASDVAGSKAISSTESKPKPIKTFLSYAHADEIWRKKIAPNLNILQREGLLTIWHDLQIKPGDKWDDEIKAKLEEAELYLFLVSSALLDSEYVLTVELPIAKRREEEKKARLIPIILRNCSWKTYVGEIQALPTAGRAIKKWRDRDDAFFDVEQGLRRTISEMHSLFNIS